MTPRVLVVAFDFSDPARRALEWARLLCTRLRATVTVVHVDDAALSAEPDRAGGRARRLEDELHREIERVFGSDADAVRVHVATGDASERLPDLALELDADLVVAGSTGKSAVERVLLGSVTDDLLHRSVIPVMIVH